MKTMIQPFVLSSSS